jgi:hypothetical protein
LPAQPANNKTCALANQSNALAVLEARRMLQLYHGAAAVLGRAMRPAFLQGLVPARALECRTVLVHSQGFRGNQSKRRPMLIY